MVKYLARDVITILKKEAVLLTTVESCTGGMLASALTDIEGASAVFERGFITYSNQSKIETLGVKPDIIKSFGAVSAQTASNMALGALQYSKADFAIAITGVAGPKSSESKPIGLVYIAIAHKDGGQVFENHFDGDRNVIRFASVTKALEIIKTHYS